MLGDPDEPPPPPHRRPLWVRRLGIAIAWAPLVASGLALAALLCWLLWSYSPWVLAGTVAACGMVGFGAWLSEWSR